MKQRHGLEHIVARLRLRQVLNCEEGKEALCRHYAGNSVFVIGRVDDGNCWLYSMEAISLSDDLLAFNVFAICQVEAGLS